MPTSPAPLDPPSSLREVVQTAPEILRAHASSRGPVWIPPRAVALPRDVDDLLSVLDWCRSVGLSLTPRGAGTGMPGGNVGPGVILDLARFSKIEAADGERIRAGAGAVAAMVDRSARRRGLHLPALPSSAPWCSAGGMVATNAAGARSFRFGAVRRWCAALDTVDSSGVVQHHRRDSAPVDRSPWRGLRDRLRRLAPPAPPAVAKNASGYGIEPFVETGDPIQLLAGSEGTLAVITSVEFDLQPLPEERAVVLIGVDDLDRLPTLARHAADTGAWACEYFGRRLLELGRLLADTRLAGLDTTAGVVLLEYAGSHAEVGSALEIWAGRGSVARDPDGIEALWSLRHGASPAIAEAAGRRRSIQFIEDCVVPVERLPIYIRGVEEALRRQGLDAVVFGHAGDGHVHVNPLVDLRHPHWRRQVRSVLDETADLVADLGGTMSGEHGDGRIRAPLLDRIWDAGHREAFRMVKQTLDPDGRLNPGVILAEPGQDPLVGFAEGPDLQRIHVAASAS